MEEMMNKGLKKAAVFGLSAVLAMSSLAGCSKKEEKTFDAAQTAVTINGTEISAGTVKFMTHYMQAATESFYDQYFGAGSMNMAIDENGTTLGEMMKEQNIASLTSMVLMEQHMEEYGVALTEEEKAAISEAVAAFLADNDEEVLTKMGATQEDVERYLELNTIQVKMTPAMSADVDTEVSDEEAAQRKIQYALFTAETEGESEEETEAVSEAETTGETEEETAAETAGETEAETVAETAEETEAETAGETESETAAETAEESESETAALEENETTKTKSAAETETEEVTEAAESESETETETETEDPAMVAAMEEAYAKAEQAIALIKDGGDFEESIKSIDEDLTVRDLTFGSDSTSVVAALVTATEGVADDTLIEVPVEGSTGYYVVKVITQLDREATDAKKETIVEERKSERVTELLTEWQEAAEVTQDDEVLAQIVFDFSLALEEETENVTEAVSEAESESETAAESENETEAESESETAAETESESETAAETESESETAVSETEAESETAAETESESETESETEA